MKMHKLIAWIDNLTKTPIGCAVFVILYIQAVTFVGWMLIVIGKWIYESDILILQVSATALLFALLLIAGVHSPWPKD